MTTIRKFLAGEPMYTPTPERYIVTNIMRLWAQARWYWDIEEDLGYPGRAESGDASVDGVTGGRQRAA
jgi:hypothetical protein